MGLSFCLPKPYGCSCYHGFTGSKCNQVTDLAEPFPYLKYAPSVSLENSTATIGFTPWRAGEDFGRLYGMKIHFYKVSLSPTYGGTISKHVFRGTDQKWLTASFEIEKEILYRASVTIKLEGVEKTGRENFKENILIKEQKFIQPCKASISREDIRITPKSDNDILITVPVIKHKFSYNISCTLNFSYNSEQSTCRKQVPPNDEAMSCRMNLPPGEIGKGDFFCRNTFGGCHSISFKEFGDFSLGAFVSQTKMGFHVRSFPVLLLPAAELRIYELDKGKKISDFTSSSRELQRVTYIGHLVRNSQVTLDLERFLYRGITNFVIMLRFHFEGKTSTKLHRLEFCPDFITVDGEKYNCEKFCLSSELLRKSKVIGTDFYHESSPICLSALHARVISEEGGEVEFKRHVDSSDRRFQATVRNRILSESQNGKIGYYFTTPPIIPPRYVKGIWPSDVFLIHNSSRIGDSFMVACLADQMTTVDYLYKWNNDLEYYTFQELNYGIKINPGNKNRRIYVCRGKDALTDVTGIFQKSNDRPEIASSLVGIQGKPLALEEAMGKRGFYKKLPNDWRYSFGSPPVALTFSTLSHGDEGIYIYKDFHEDEKWKGNLRHTIEGNGAYFQLFVRECETNKYGPNCFNECPKCHHGGICHPLVGSCICRPGFSGPTCQNICPLDKFGSKCQLSCSISSYFASRTCRGMIFCLPRPYGCGCAHGYKGRFCQEIEELVVPFPSFKRSPTVHLHENGTIEVSFSAWNSSEDEGNLYGSKISHYKVKYKKKSSINWKFNRVEAGASSSYSVLFPANLSEALYEVSVDIILKDYARSGKDLDSRRSQAPKRHFASACVGKDKKFDFKSKMTSIKVEVPLPKLKHGFPIKCSLWFKPSKQDEKLKAIPCGGKDITEEGENFVCQPKNLKPGEKFLIKTQCRNRFGSCNRTAETATHPDLKSQIIFDRENSYLNLSNFGILTQASSNLSIYSLLNTPENFMKVKDIIANFENRAKQELKNNTDLKQIKELKAGEIPLYVSFEEKKDKLIIVAFEYEVNGIHYERVEFIALEVVFTYLNYLALLLLLPLIIGLLIYKRKSLMRLINKEASGKEKDQEESKALEETENFYAATNGKKEQIPKSNQDPPTELSVIFKPDQQILSAYDTQLAGSGVENDLQMPTPNLDKIPLTGSPFSPSKGELDIKDEDGDFIYDNVENLDIHLDIEKYLVMSIDSQRVAEEFKSIPAYDNTRTFEYCKDPNNKQKNRYINNHPYDETRVVLSKIRGDPFSDYINANFIENPYNKKKWYIAAQGPKDSKVNTMSDFWRMVLENDVEVIVMVANFIENNKRKVGEYFNRNEAMAFSDCGFRVEVLEVTHEANYILSVIQISHSRGFKKVNHFQYIIWPDHGIPSEAYSLSVMMKAIVNCFVKGGIVVHCSAGIGRTGTVLLILLTMEMQQNNGNFDPMTIVRQMRHCRARLVENHPQYNFGLKVLYEMYFEGIGVVTQDDLQERIEPNKDREEPMESIMQSHDHLYPRLESLPFHHLSECLANPVNEPYNRNPQLLPPDLKRVFLDPPNNIHSYINAIEMKFDSIDPLIVTVEHPLPVSLPTFWWMIMEKSCGTLVIINEIKPSENYPGLIPSSKTPSHIGDIVLENTSSEQFNSHIQKLEMVIKYQNHVHPLKILQLSDWLVKEECPSDPCVLTSLVDIIMASSDDTVVFCCGDGVTGCGLLAGSLLLIANFIADQNFNIYKTAIELRKQRPHFIVSQKQFNFLYSVADFYLKNFVLYTDAA